MTTVRTGLDRLAAHEGPELEGRKVALLCHPASVDARLVHDAPHNLVWEEGGQRMIHRKG